MKDIYNRPVIERIIQMQEYGKQETDEINNLRMIYESNRSPMLAKVINFKESTAKQRLMLESCPDFEVPQLTLFEGNIELGTIAMNNFGKIPIFLSKTGMSTHIVICGRTTSGKSREGLNLFRQSTCQEDIKSVFFANAGNEQGVIPLCKDTLILDCSEKGNFRFDILSPVPEANLAQNIDSILNPLGHALWLGIASTAEIRPVLEEIMREKLNGKNLTIKDFETKVKGLKNSEARNKVLNRLAHISHSEFLDVSMPSNMDIFSKANIIFLTKSLTNYEEMLFIYTFLSKLFLYKKAIDEQNREFSNKIINMAYVEEAQRFLNNTEREDSAMMPLYEIISKGAKYGVSLVLLFQTVYRVDPQFLSQAGVLVCGPLEHGDDVYTMQKLLGLDSKQAEFYKNMASRNFIVRQTPAKPFPFEATELILQPEIITPEYIQNWNNETIKWNPEYKKLIYKETKKETPIIQKTDEYYFMEAVNNHVMYPTAYYYKVLEEHYQQAKANDIRKELIEKGYLQSHKINTGSKIFFNGLEITEIGYQKYELRRNLTYSKGAGFVHSYIAENLKRYFEKKGKKTEREKQIRGHFCDLFVEPDLAVEVAIGNLPAYEVKNIKYNIAENLRTFVVGNDKEHIENIRKLMPEMYRESLFVEFKLFADYL